MPVKLNMFAQLDRRRALFGTLLLHLSLFCALLLLGGKGVLPVEQSSVLTLEFTETAAKGRNDRSDVLVVLRSTSKRSSVAMVPRRTVVNVNPRIEGAQDSTLMRGVPGGFGASAVAAQSVRSVPSTGVQDSRSRNPVQPSRGSIQRNARSSELFLQGPAQISASASREVNAAIAEPYQGALPVDRVQLDRAQGVSDESTPSERGRVGVAEVVGVSASPLSSVGGDLGTARSSPVHTVESTDSRAENSVPDARFDATRSVDSTPVFTATEQAHLGSQRDGLGVGPVMSGPSTALGTGGVPTAESSGRGQSSRADTVMGQPEGGMSSRGPVSESAGVAQGAGGGGTLGPASNGAGIAEGGVRGQGGVRAAGQGDGPADSRASGTGTLGDAASGDGIGGGKASGTSGRAEPERPGGALASTREAATFRCAIVVDTRGLSSALSASISPAITDETGQKIWPPAATVQGVETQFVNSMGIATYASTLEEARRQLVEQVPVFEFRAIATRPSEFAPRSKFHDYAVLSNADALQFLSVNQNCQVILVK